MSPEAQRKLEEITQLAAQIKELEAKLNTLLGIGTPAQPVRKTKPQKPTAAKEKKEYSCSVCHKPGHTAKTCPTKKTASKPDHAFDEFAADEAREADNDDNDDDEQADESEALNIERFFEIKDLFKRGSSSKDISIKLGIPLKEVNAVLQFTKYSSYLTHRDRVATRV